MAKHSTLHLTATACLVLITVTVFGQTETQNPATLPAGAGVFWKTTGNANTVDGTHFLGTTDDVPLTLRVNNVLAGRVDDALNSTFWGYEAGLSNLWPNNTYIGYQAGRASGTAQINTFVGSFAGVTNVSGNENTYIGAGAGRLNVSGFNNTMLGAASGFSNTSSYNTFLGYRSGAANTSGRNNTAVGNRSLHNNVTGGNLVAMGDSALFNNSSGSRNVAVGSRAAYSITTGSTVTAIGDSALYSNIQSSNTAVGASALAYNTTAFANTALGMHALRRSNGSYNTALGGLVLSQNTSGASNTGAGANAMISNTTGSNNTAIGASALYNNTTGGSNVALGVDALRNNGNGPSSVAIGVQSMFNNVSGGYSVAVGYRAMESANQSGAFPFNYNVAVGYSALLGSGVLVNNTGIENSAIGTFSMQTNASGSYNSTLGTYALDNNSTGNYNVAVGYNALPDNTSGTENTAVGYQSGTYNFSGQFNTLIGSRTSGFVNLTNATAIGYRSIVSQSNSLVLGSISGLNGSSATVNVGIGTPVPTDRLHIVGTFRMEDGFQANNRVMVSDAFGAGRWQTLTTAQTNAWGLTGNIGTVDGTNFIGTMDVVPLTFRAGNQVAGRVELSTQNTFFGHTAGSSNAGVGNSFFGADAGFTNSSGAYNTFMGEASGVNNTIGSFNAFYGSTSGYNNTTGTSNTFIGRGTGYANTTGQSNTASGEQSLFNNISGGNNVAIGYHSLFDNTIGVNNTAVGNNAGAGITTGNNNTILGSNADALLTGISNSAAIGNNAKVSASNNVIIGDTVTRTKLGIGVTAVGKTLSSSIMEVASQGTLDDLLFRYSGTGFPSFNFQKTNGTLAAPTALSSSATLGQINFSAYTGSAYVNSAMIRSYTVGAASGITPPPTQMDFWVSNGSFMYNTLSLTSNIRVGVVKTDPQTTLHVGYGSDAERTIVQSGFFMLGDEAATNILMDNNEIMARDATATSPLYFQVDGGNVGIGNTGAPAYQLELSTNSAGKPTSTVWTVSSDRRLKKDIRPYEGGLKEILQIKPVWYRYNGLTGLPTDEEGVGTIAQELEQVAPYMIKPYIKEDDKGVKTEYKSVDYNAMLFMFVNAIKELKSENMALKNRLDLLEKK